MSPEAKRSRVDGDGVERLDHSSMASSTIPLGGLPSSASAPDWLPATWRNNFIGYDSSTPPPGASFGNQGRSMRLKPSTTPLPSEAIKPGKGRRN